MSFWNCVRQANAACEKLLELELPFDAPDAPVLNEVWALLALTFSASCGLHLVVEQTAGMLLVHWEVKAGDLRRTFSTLRSVNDWLLSLQPQNHIGDAELLAVSNELAAGKDGAA